MRVLVFGRSGQVARELARRCPPAVEATFLGRGEADLAHPDACARAVLDHRPDAVINAAAWTAVDKAEACEAEATVVNGDAPGAMARGAAELGIPFLHLSTDYVFDGEGTEPFPPDAPTGPLGAYGRSKLAGETVIRAAGGRHLILRTSWVFSAHGTNFVKTMLKLGRERDRVRVVADQVGGPTPAAAIADALFLALRRMSEGPTGGTHHFSGAPDNSWADFARQIMAAAGLSCAVDGIPSSEYPTPARRPLNSRLDCSSFERTFGMPRPSWHEGLAEILDDLGENA
jgi:dTDP-4-dehydrorhamnose reductase